MSGVRTQAEYGTEGYRALVEKYGSAQVDRWRRMGGRRRNRTYAEIVAERGHADRGNGRGARRSGSNGAGGGEGSSPSPRPPFEGAGAPGPSGRAPSRSKGVPA